MQTQTKQRILGALVILALLAIILPFIFRSSSLSFAQKNNQNKKLSQNNQKVLEQPVTSVTVVKQPKQIIPQQVADSQFQQSQVATIKHADNNQIDQNQNKAQISASQQVTHSDQARSFTLAESNTKTAKSLQQPKANKANNVTLANVQLKRNDKPQVTRQTISSNNSSLNETNHNALTAPTNKNINTSAKKAAIKDNTSQTKSLSAAPVTQSIIHRQVYALQLGSFSNKSNVDKLIIKLRKMGFTAFFKPIQVSTKKLYRVYIGPELKKSNMLAWQKRLNKSLHINSKIVIYKSTT